MKEKVSFNWSGGKDSALALHKLLASDKYDVQSLITTFSDQYRRVSMHGVREELIEAQAQQLGIDLEKVYIPESVTMEAYDTKMKEVLSSEKEKGSTLCAYGDIFLEDLKAYRDNVLAEIGLRGVYPLWGAATRDIVEEFISLGFKAVTTCVDSRYLDESFTGRIIDAAFLDDLPQGVDPCGENGEFHSFVFDGPIFTHPIPYITGEKVFKTYSLHSEDPPSEALGFWFCDLLLST